DTIKSMKAKKMMTKGDDGVIKVLKEVENATVDHHTKSSDAETLQKWASLEGENESESSKNNQKDNLIYGNPSFLSRFIEHRKDDKVSCIMPNSTQKEREIYLKIESPVNFESSIDEVNRPDDQVQGIDKVQSNMTEIYLRDHAYDSSKENIAANRDITSKEPARTVEEIRRRIEGNVENSKTPKESKSPLPKLKNNKVDTKSKTTVHSKEDGNKFEIRRNNSNTRDSPPRKVSFKVRSSINNGKTCSSSLSSSRRSAASKLIHMESRSSSKVAALASKFNAIIYENKDVKGNNLLSSDTKKKSVSTPQLTMNSPKISSMNSQTSRTVLPTVTKKLSPSEKTVLSRRTSNNLKKENR
ncbi:hypothetical protein L9F63_016528, partial [Diploptera punctata]